MVKKLILGTANFGMEYGIAFGKKVQKEEAFRILESCAQAGIWGIDTASAYGDAENVLGEFFGKRGKVFKVITKLPNGEYVSREKVVERIKESLTRLRLGRIDFLLLHSFKTFRNNPEKVVEGLRLAKEEGLIEKYGISVYHPEEVEEFYSFCKEPMGVEFPLNVFDRRFLPFLKHWKALGMTLFARSVFLQGLFFLERFEGSFKKVEGKIKGLRLMAQSLGIDFPCLLLSFVAGFEELEGFIVGVDSVEQLKKNIECLKNPIKLELEDFQVDDEDIILPYRWHTTA